jgi:hypothetical protein
MSENTKKSPAAVILFAWVLVSVPLGWGVYNTVLNSMKLFQAPPAATVPVNAAPAKYRTSSAAMAADVPRWSSFTHAANLKFATRMRRCVGPSFGEEAVTIACGRPARRDSE